MRRIRQVTFGSRYTAVLPSSWDRSCMPNAIAFGDTDGDGRNEVAIGTSGGQLAIFKPISGACTARDYESLLASYTCTNLGTISCVTIGQVRNLSSSKFVARNIVVISAEGLLSLIEIRNAVKVDLSKQKEEEPLPSKKHKPITIQPHLRFRICPNPSAVLLMEIDYQGRNSKIVCMIVGTTNGEIYAYTLIDDQLLCIHAWQVPSKVMSLSSIENRFTTPCILVGYYGGYDFLWFSFSSPKKGMTRRVPAEIRQCSTLMKSSSYQKLFGIPSMASVRRRYIGSGQRDGGMYIPTATTADVSGTVFAHVNTMGCFVVYGGRENKDTSEQGANSKKKDDTQRLLKPKKEAWPQRSVLKEVEMITRWEKECARRAKHERNKEAEKSGNTAVQDDVEQQTFSEREELLASKRSQSKSVCPSDQGASTGSSVAEDGGWNIPLLDLHLHHELFSVQMVSIDTQKELSKKLSNSFSRSEGELEDAIEEENPTVWIVACAYDGHTYIADPASPGHLVRYHFPDSVAAFAAGELSVRSFPVKEPVFAYITTTGRLYIYYDLAASVRNVALPQLLNHFREKLQTDMVLKTDQDAVHWTRAEVACLLRSTLYHTFEKEAYTLYMKELENQVSQIRETCKDLEEKILKSYAEEEAGTSAAFDDERVDTKM